MEVEAEAEAEAEMEMEVRRMRRRRMRRRTRLLPLLIHIQPGKPVMNLHTSRWFCTLYLVGRISRVISWNMDS